MTTLKEQMRRQMQARNQEPDVVKTQRFLNGYMTDTLSLEEVEAKVAAMVSVNTSTLHRGLDGIEGVLADPASHEEVWRIIEVEVGWSIPKEEVAPLLDTLAQMLRKHLSL